MLLRKKCVRRDLMFRIVTMCYGSGGWGGGRGYSGFQLIGIVKNNSLFKPGKIHQEYKKS